MDRNRLFLMGFGIVFQIFVAVMAKAYAAKMPPPGQQARRYAPSMSPEDGSRSKAEFEKLLASAGTRVEEEKKAKSEEEIASLMKEVERLRAEVRGMDLAARAASRAAAGTAARASGSGGGDIDDFEQTADGIRVELMGCRLEGNLLEVDFQIVNVTEGDFAATLSDQTVMKTNSRTIHWPDRIAFGDKSEKHPRQTLVAGLPVGGTAYFTNVDPDMFVVPFLSLCVTKGSTQDPDCYTFRDIPLLR